MIFNFLTNFDITTVVSFLEMSDIEVIDKALTNENIFILCSFRLLKM